MNINDLPIEVLHHVFQYMSQNELLLAISPVCRFWKDLAYDPLRWRSLELSFNQLPSVVASGLLQQTSLLEVVVINSSRRDPVLPGILSDFFESCSLLGLPLVEIQVNYCTSVHSITLMAAIKNFKPTLKRLSLEGCRTVNSESLQVICQLSGLTHLNLSHCTCLADENLTTISQELDKIVSLKLDGICHLTDAYVFCILFVAAFTIFLKINLTRDIPIYATYGFRS